MVSAEEEAVQPAAAEQAEVSKRFKKLISRLYILNLEICACIDGRSLFHIERGEIMFTLYTRFNCPLCDEAKLMIGLINEDYPLAYQEIDIESDEALHEKYMMMIPVLEKDNEVLLYGNIGYVELLEALEI